MDNATNAESRRSRRRGHDKRGDAGNEGQRARRDGRDIEAAVLREVQELERQAGEGASRGKRRRQSESGDGEGGAGATEGGGGVTVMQTNVKGAVFLAVEGGGRPSARLERLFGSLRTAQGAGFPFGRHVMRLVPVDVTCFAAPAEAAAAARASVAQWLQARGRREGEGAGGGGAEGRGAEALRFKVEFRRRFNSGASRDDFISHVAAAVADTPNATFKVGLDDPDLVVLVEVLKSTCAVAATGGAGLRGNWGFSVERARRDCDRGQLDPSGKAQFNSWAVPDAEAGPEGAGIAQTGGATKDEEDSEE